MIKLASTLQRAVPEVSKFLTVGLAAYVVDVGLFNLLRYGGEVALLAEKPLTAKAVSTVCAIFVAYTGNKLWTYGSRSGQTIPRELIIFFAINGVAMAIALVCLWISHYALGLTSPLADNIAANIVGIGLGTLFRFFAYRRWVFVD